jgi:hypothetical protein
VLATITTSASYVDEIVADERTRDALSSRIENVLWDKAMQAEPGSDLQLLFFDTHVRIATSPGVVGRLASMLAGTATPPLGIELDQDRRWSALAAVTRTGDSRAAGLLADEISRDGSDDGRLRALAAGAALPDPANKLRTIESLVSGDGINNLAEFRALAGGLFPRGQHRQQLSHAPAAIAGLQTINDEHDAEYFGAYTGGLLGPACDANYLLQLEAALETEMDLHPLIRRSLLDSRFETARCLRIRERQIAGRNADTID